MKVTAAIASSLLLASTAVAAPYADRRASAISRRNARRQGRFHTNPLDPSNMVEEHGALYQPTSTTHWNAGPGGWAGAVMASQSGVSAVQATVTVPTPVIPPNGDSSGGTQYGGSAWVGIDGYGTGTLWQTGVTWTIQGSQQSFSGWYEWFPAGSVAFGNITVAPGDQIAMSVVATSTTSGTAYLTNESTGQQVSQTMTGQPALVQQSAEWIVEDFGVSGGSIPFAGFSPAVTFSGASYTDNSGSNQGLNNPVIVEVGQSSAPFTSCSASGSSSVSCSYIGNAANS